MLIGAHDFAVPINIIETQLHDHREFISVEVAMPTETNIAAEPSVTKHHTDSIRPAAQQARYIVGLILQPLVVAGPTRRKQPIRNALPIQIDFIETMTGDISTRFFDRALCLKRMAQQWRRLRGGSILVQIGFDPGGLPV